MPYLTCWSGECRRKINTFKTEESAAIRLLVPILDLHKLFEMQINEVEKGFFAVKKLSDLVKSVDVGEGNVNVLLYAEWGE